MHLLDEPQVRTFRIRWTKSASTGTVGCYHARAMTLSAVPMVLIMVLVLLALGSASVAQDVADVALLKEAAMRHRANRESIVTWRGRVAVTTSTVKPEEPKSETSHATVAFAWNVSSSQKRWNWKMNRDGETPEGAGPLESGMISDGAYYWLKTNDRSQGCYVTVYPPNEAVKAMESPFTTVLDPEFWLTYYGAKVDEYLLAMHNQWHELQKRKDMSHKLTRQDNVVTIETSMELPGRKGVVSRMSFDLSQAGNLVLWSNDDPNVTQQWEWKHEKVAGLWVPKEVSIEHEQRKRPSSRTRKLVWLENVLNDDFDSDAFSLAAMGARPGDVVTDTRSGVEYKLTRDDIPDASSGTKSQGAWWWWIIGIIAVPAAILFFIAARRWRATHAT